MRRALEGMRDAELTSHERAAIIRRQNGMCFHCGLNLGLAVIYGHLVPRHADGTHDTSNRIAVHGECEARINARDRQPKAPMPTEQELAKQARLLLASKESE